jgi:hypothetical protein
MADALKAAGKAVATAKGHYPDASGRHVALAPGQTFTVWEGQTKSKWFTLLAEGAPAAEPAKAPVPEKEPDTFSGAAAAERQRKAKSKPPLEDPLA